jgi:hypothetical protein
MSSSPPLGDSYPVIKERAMDTLFECLRRDFEAGLENREYRDTYQATLSIMLRSAQQFFVGRRKLMGLNPSSINSTNHIYFILGARILSIDVPPKIWWEFFT